MENTNQKNDLKVGDENPVNRTSEHTKLREEVIVEMEAESKAEIAKFDAMEEMDGQEVWTNAFGDRFEERVCVGISGNICGCKGETFKPTKEEIKNLWNDYMENELGTPAQRNADIEAEFTPEYCKQLFEEEVEERIKKKLESIGTPERPKYDRCNKGHLLEWDANRNVWDCPICIKMMQEAN